MRMNPTWSVFVIGFLASGIALRPALAATATASFSVSATVVSGCQATPTTQTFKSYAAASTNATSSIAVTCTLPTPYVVSLGTEVVPDYDAAIAKAIGPGSALRGSAQPSQPQHIAKTTGTPTAAASSSSQSRTAPEQAAAAQIPASGTNPDSVMVSITY